jgi:hypothetical protein
MTNEDPNSTSTPPSDDNTPDAFSGTDTDSDILGSLVGPGKKFASVEDLAKGKLQADLFIKKTTDENAQLRQVVADLSKETDTSAALKQLVEHLMTKGTPAPGDKPPQSNGADTSNSRDNQLGLTRDDVVALLKQSERDKVAQANRTEANRKLHSMYGDKAPTVLANKARDLGLSVDNLKALAESSPKAFSAMLGLDTNEAPPSASRPGAAGRGSVNSAAALRKDVHNNTGLRGTKYYEKLKNEMGIRKFVLDTGLQLQMHKDMELLGDEFDNH